MTSWTRTTFFISSRLTVWMISTELIQGPVTSFTANSHWNVIAECLFVCQADDPSATQTDRQDYITRMLEQDTRTHKDTRHPVLIALNPAYCVSWANTRHTNPVPNTSRICDNFGSKRMWHRHNARVILFLDERIYLDHRSLQRRMNLSKISTTGMPLRTQS